ncbi:putative inhibitor of apoptosis isoform X2 [Linepithema humile]|uniref:putative inhibitor of apoptosis isoform X2 n=1 Tax=Linepithema humile TaxID=83485 RepID=UPI0006237B98|nr:PREDICTED: baculoviral IAP repeat-containing protein 7-B isoform X2 [Linepithema humile]
MDRENATMSCTTSSQKELQKKYLTFQQRLQTFENWPLTSIISPQQLASAGFYYLQHKDMVECLYCKGVFMNWKPGDDPESEHKLYFPHCDFLKQKQEKDDTENEVVKSEIKNLSGSSRYAPPKYPQYALHERRLQTFTDWPNEVKQTPEMLAEAGFYYVGPEDFVRCFYCGGGLNRWKQEDNVWKEHAQWFSYCGFVNLVQGSQFVKRCVDSRTPLHTLIASCMGSDSTEVNTINPVSLNVPTTSTKVSVLQFSEPDTLTERLTHTDLTTNEIETVLNTVLISRVKETLKRRQELGEPYMNVEQFIEDVLADQTVENTKFDSNSPELIYLLNQLVTEMADISTSKNTPESDALLKSQLKKKEMDNKSDITFLEEENRKLKEDRLCKICMDCALAIVFLPCGHLATCSNCAPILTNCPMCRQRIRGCIRIFLS